MKLNRNTYVIISFLTYLLIYKSHPFKDPHLSAAIHVNSGCVFLCGQAPRHTPMRMKVVLPEVRRPPSLHPCMRTQTGHVRRLDQPAPSWPTWGGWETQTHIHTHIQHTHAHTHKIYTKGRQFSVGM